jgi:hypothetical protein
MRPPLHKQNQSLHGRERHNEGQTPTQRKPRSVGHPSEARRLAALEGVLLFQFFEGLAAGVLETLGFGHERGQGFGPAVVVEVQQSLWGDETAGDIDEMLRSGLQILGFGRIGDADAMGDGGVCRLDEFRFPENFSLEEGGGGVVGRLAEDPLLALEIVVAAGKRDGQKLSRFEEFDLSTVNFFAQGVDDGSFGVFGIERRHDFADSLRQVDGDGRMQAVGAFEANVAMEHPEVGAGGRGAKRPVETDRERKSGERDPDSVGMGFGHVALILSKFVRQHVREQQVSGLAACSLRAGCVRRYTNSNSKSRPCRTKRDKDGAPSQGGRMRPPLHKQSQSLHGRERHNEGQTPTQRKARGVGPPVDSRAKARSFFLS